MENQKNNRPLRICYIWQYATADKEFNSLSATKLHSKAVIDEFRKRGHHVRMIIFHQGTPHWSDDLVSWHPIKPIELSKAFRIMESIIRGVQSRLHLPYVNIFESYRFAKTCLDTVSDCNVIYERFWMLASGGSILAKKLGVPILYEVNGDLVEEYKQQKLYLSKIQWAAIHMVTKLMYENASKVITVSKTLRERIISRYRLTENKVCSIENGAHVERFLYPDLNKVEEIRQKYDLQDRKVIIFVGTFKPWHGIDLLIVAFAEIVKDYPTTKLLLVGDGPLRQELETLTSKLNLEKKVIFTGPIPHERIPALLKVADIAILNPKVSGASTAQSPLKLFEYMASGKAIIAPKISNNEDILNHGVTGYLILPGEQHLKEAMIRLLEDGELRSKLGLAAAKQADEYHSWAVTASNIESIMYDVID